MIWTYSQCALCTLHSILAFLQCELYAFIIIQFGQICFGLVSTRETAKGFLWLLALLVPMCKEVSVHCIPAWYQWQTFLDCQSVSTMVPLAYALCRTPRYPAAAAGVRRVVWATTTKTMLATRVPSRHLCVEWPRCIPRNPRIQWLAANDAKWGQRQPVASVSDCAVNSSRETITFQLNSPRQWLQTPVAAISY